MRILIVTVLCIQMSAVAIAEGDNLGPFTDSLTSVSSESRIKPFIDAFISKKSDYDRYAVLIAYSENRKNRASIDHRVLYAIIIGLVNDQYKSGAIKTMLSSGVFFGKISQDVFLKVLSCYKTDQTKLEAIALIKEYDGAEAFDAINLLKLLNFFESDQFKFSALKMIGRNNGIMNLNSDSILGVLRSFKSDIYVGAAFREFSP